MKNKNENFLKYQILINFFKVVSINLCKRDNHSILGETTLFL